METKSPKTEKQLNWGIKVNDEKSWKTRSKSRWKTGNWLNSKLNLWSQESERPPPDACFHIFAALAEVKENVDGMKLLLSQSFPEKTHLWKWHNHPKKNVKTKFCNWLLSWCKFCPIIQNRIMKSLLIGAIMIMHLSIHEKSLLEWQRMNRPYISTKSTYDAICKE